MTEQGDQTIGRLGIVFVLVDLGFGIPRQRGMCRLSIAYCLSAI